MATVVLQYAGAAVGTFLGGPIGGIIGRAIGGVAGNIVDQNLFGSSSHREGPRLNGLQVMASEEGAPIPVVFGRMRIGGQVIWASPIEEVATTTTASASGKGGPSNSTTEYSYFGSFAVGLCEGEIAGLGRVWADGQDIDIGQYQTRLYTGTETQFADSLITASDGESPAYRGLAYIVFERLPLASFGNRIPQLTFEVVRSSTELAGAIKSVNIIPGATEFGYDTTIVTRNIGSGHTASENAHVSAARSDFTVSLNELQAQCANVSSASLVVAWFGNDLRCGHCMLKPGVDSTKKSTSPLTWNVGGTLRNAAHLVSLHDGAPAFGGTPSDASVVRAIQDMRARGLKVTFYPFVLMDVPTGNSLPDPYGGTSQAAYPWRGRITASKAPGIAGSPDKTAAMATEIASFVGAASAANFMTAGTKITYAGPDEWSFRRMILHYAKLCAAAGGVDAFLIGSEFAGLTTLRSSANTYPFVAALQALAANVKLILPDAKISYAADWSEYFGHHPNDGSGDLYFHLDPLWSSSSIDFIGVDNYLPLADWREGTAHLDYQAGTRSTYDQNYLAANIAGGEFYDWYYATPEDRDNQLRSPISDGAYGKPWIYRPKDFANWWLNPHYNRPAGIESAVATDWVPQSKPIRFTELGCPAIDKGLNQPNVFVDAKSSESALPYYSNGFADDQAQASYALAMENHWGSSGAHNPVSSIYHAPMVSGDDLSFWAWDARPYPAFPAKLEVWADGANYQRGHWLNGRMASVDLSHLIRELAERFGFSDVDVSGVEGRVDGFVIDRAMSARDALEGLLQAFAIDAIESDGKLKFTARRNIRAIELSSDDLVETEADQPIFITTRAQEADIPSAVKLTYAEAAVDYRSAAVSARRIQSSSAREVTINLPAAVAQDEAQSRADMALAESWAARETAKFALPPSFRAVEPGDVIEVAGNRWRVKTLTDGTARQIEATAFDSNLYALATTTWREVTTPEPEIYGAPEALLMDMAVLPSSQSPAPWLAAQAKPWPGTLAVLKKTGPSSFIFNSSIAKQATMGETLSPLPNGLTDRLDFTHSFDVKLHYGALHSVSDDELLGGANLAVVGDSGSGFEVIQFRDAVLIAEDTYRLTGLLRAQGGSGPEMLDVRDTGANFVLLNAAVHQLSTSTADNFNSSWRIGPAKLDSGDSSYLEIDFSGQQKALRPLSVTGLKFETSDAGLKFSWIRRGRLDADSWDLAEIPLGEAGELYQIDFLNGTILKRSVRVSSPEYLYPASDVTSDFAGWPSALTVRICQLSAAFGRGALLERIFNV